MTSLSQQSINNSLTRANSSEIAGFGKPSDKYDELVVGASGTEYVAPANGFFQFERRAQQAGARIGAHGNISCTFFAQASSQTYYIYVPVLKGQIFKFEYSGTGDNAKARFFYDIGTEKEAENV